MATAIRTRSSLKHRTFTTDFQPAAVGSDETTPLFAVPAGWRVVDARYKVLIASAASSAVTMTLGDGDDPDGYLTAFDPETATTADNTGAFMTAAGAGKLYTADDTIDVVYDQTTPGATNPKVQFQITMVQEAPQ